MESALLTTDIASVASRDWQMLSNDTPIPEQGGVIVLLDRWLLESATFSNRGAPVGVKLPNDTSIQQLSPALLDRPLLVLDFPGFADGRAYSQARQLRARGYINDLRATGAAVVLDQLKYMMRCGITSFDIRSDQDAKACAAILARTP